MMRIMEKELYDMFPKVKATIREQRDHRKCIEHKTFEKKIKAERITEIL